MERILLLILLVIAQLAKCDSSCDCPIQNNYEGSYVESIYENQPHDHADDRVCSSSNIWFHNECWLEEFNHTHHADLSVVSDSNCPHENKTCIFLCVTTFNPICAFNRLTETTQTLQNLCNYQCQNGGKDLDVLYCGPCGIPCPDMIENLNCIGDTLPPCTVDPQNPIKNNTSPSTCDPRNNSFICGRDTVTGNMKLYDSPCELDRAKEVNPNMDSLYHAGTPGACPCNNSSK